MASWSLIPSEHKPFCVFFPTASAVGSIVILHCPDELAAAEHQGYHYVATVARTRSMWHRQHRTQRKPRSASAPAPATKGGNEMPLQTFCVRTCRSLSFSPSQALIALEPKGLYLHQSEAVVSKRMKSSLWAIPASRCAIANPTCIFCFVICSIILFVSSLERFIVFNFFLSPFLGVLPILLLFVQLSHIC